MSAQDVPLFPSFDEETFDPFSWKGGPVRRPNRLGPGPHCKPVDEGETPNWHVFAKMLPTVLEGGSLGSVIPAFSSLATSTDTRMGKVLREGGRVPYPVLEGQRAIPKHCTYPYPPDITLPLPLPEIPSLPPRGRGRERAKQRLLRLHLLETAVALVNV